MDAPKSRPIYHLHRIQTDDRDDDDDDDDDDGDDGDHDDSDGDEIKVTFMMEIVMMSRIDR